MGFNIKTDKYHTINSSRNKGLQTKLITFIKFAKNKNIRT